MSIHFPPNIPSFGDAPLLYGIDGAVHVVLYLVNVLTRGYYGHFGPKSGTGPKQGQSETTRNISTTTFGKGSKTEFINISPVNLLF